MITIRPWTLDDAPIIVAIRNNPELRQWFRQEQDLTVDVQCAYMVANPDYRGYMIEDEGKPVGVVALHGEELCIAAPLEDHVAAIAALEEAEKPLRMWGEVFTLNPALPFYLFNCGFTAKAYISNRYIKNGEPVNVVRIEKICAY